MRYSANEPFLRKSRPFLAYAGTANALIERYQISRAHMDMLLSAVAERGSAPSVFEGTLEAITERYSMSRPHLAMLVEAMTGLVELLESGDHRVDHD